MMRKILPVIFIFLLLFGLACGKESEPAPVSAAVESTTPEPTEVQVQETPQPTREPKITDEWYTNRNEAIQRYLKEYTSLSDAEIAVKLDNMFIDPDAKKIAFTFDDGPNSTYTSKILDILEEYNARATFYLVGSHIAGNEDLIKRTLTLGCELGSHTWDHTDVESLSTKAEMEEAILSVTRKLDSDFGYAVNTFRPPYISYGKKGSETRENLVAIMKENDMVIVNHARSVHDTYDDYNADMIYERGVEEKDELGHGLNNSIILCHDKSQKMVDAFRRIVPELQSKGYQLVTVSELLYCSEEGFHPGWIYTKAD